MMPWCRGRWAGCVLHYTDRFRCYSVIAIHLGNFVAVATDMAVDWFVAGGGGNILVGPEIHIPSLGAATSMPPIS